MTAVATTTRTIVGTVTIAYTTAALIRCTAKTDIEEYELKAGEIFYLARSSQENGLYYVLRWSYTESRWICKCRHSTERPLARPCRHRRLVSADCKARRDAKRAAAERVEQALAILKEEERQAACADEETLRRNMTAFYDGWTAYYAQQEGLVQAPNGAWVRPEELANVPGAPRAAYEAARAQAGYGKGVDAIVEKLNRAGLMRR